MTPTPTCSRRSPSATLTLRNRVVMGSMHTGLEDRAWDLAQAGGVLRRAGPRRRRPDRHRRLPPNRRGWLKPFARR